MTEREGKNVFRNKRELGGACSVENTKSDIALSIYLLRSYLRELLIPLIIEAWGCTLQCHKQDLATEKVKTKSWLIHDGSMRYICLNMHTFIGGYFEKGACPWASSNAVMPNDQISALQEKSEHFPLIINMSLCAKKV